MDNAEFLGRAFSEEIALEMVVGREVDTREGHITEKASTGAFVEANETEIFHYPHCGATRDVCVLGHLALDLEANFDDLKRIGKDLDTVSRELQDARAYTYNLTGAC